MGFHRSLYSDVSVPDAVVSATGGRAFLKCTPVDRNPWSGARLYENIENRSAVQVIRFLTRVLLIDAPCRRASGCRGGIDSEPFHSSAVDRSVSSWRALSQSRCLREEPNVAVNQPASFLIASS